MLSPAACSRLGTGGAGCLTRLPLLPLAAFSSTCGAQYSALITDGFTHTVLHLA
jgi:hypothetical protein